MENKKTLQTKNTSLDTRAVVWGWGSQNRIECGGGDGMMPVWSPAGWCLVRIGRDGDGMMPVRSPDWRVSGPYRAG